jgi:Domain of unknown function (DUF1707)
VKAQEADEMVDVRMRAADSDRQLIADRLKDALADGRLTTDEYMERIEAALQAVTYGDLAAVCADLPGAAGPAASPVPVAPPPASARHCACRAFAFLPLALRVLWTTWFIAVSVNVVVWVLVSGTTRHLIYPWPLWVAGPYGAVLFAMSAVSVASRRETSRAR